MPTQVKICGITGAEALAAVQAVGADACGFVFYADSPRALTPEQAAPLAALALTLLKVGVFVDADDALLRAAVAAGQLGALQLQGAETPQRVAQVQAEFGLPVWRAVGVRTRADVDAAVADYAMADLLLFDARPTEAGDRPGGNGLSFDWRILRGAALPPVWGLAGGLDAENVAAAIRLTGAPLVDVSSGVESAPGRKDVAKIVNFVEAARRV